MHIQWWGDATRREADTMGLSMGNEGQIPLESALDIAQARQLIGKLSASLGFSVIKQTKLVTATSELARNAIKYAHGGVVFWALVQSDRIGIRPTFLDRGQGIADIGLALSNGWSTGGGLGLGLPGTKRLVDEFTMSSTLGEGTRVEITMWK